MMPRINVSVRRKYSFYRAIVGADEHDPVVLAFRDNVADCAELDTAPILPLVVGA
jgi:hypothetical protein